MVSLCMSGNQWEKYLAMELYSQLEESSSFLVGSAGIIRLQLEHYTNGGAMSVGYWPSDLGMAAVIVGALKEDKQVSEGANNQSQVKHNHITITASHNSYC